MNDFYGIQYLNSPLHSKIEIKKRANLALFFYFPTIFRFRISLLNEDYEGYLSRKSIHKEGFRLRNWQEIAVDTKLSKNFKLFFPGYYDCLIGNISNK